jgi:hypothetical protein
VTRSGVRQLEVCASIMRSSWHENQTANKLLHATRETRAREQWRYTGVEAAR